MSDLIYVALYNDIDCHGESFDLYLKLSKSSDSEISLIVYVLPTLFGIIIVILIIVGVIWYRQRLSKIQLNIGLSHEKAAKKFPSVEYHLASTKTSDRNCAICLVDFLPETSVKKLSCEHIFHEQCIINWFKSSKVINI